MEAPSGKAKTGMGDAEKKEQAQYKMIFKNKYLDLTIYLLDHILHSLNKHLINTGSFSFLFISLMHIYHKLTLAMRLYVSDECFTPLFGAHVLVS